MFKIISTSLQIAETSLNGIKEKLREKLSEMLDEDFVLGIKSELKLNE